MKVGQNRQSSMVRRCIPLRHDLGRDGIQRVPFDKPVYPGVEDRRGVSVIEVTILRPVVLWLWRLKVEDD